MKRIILSLFCFALALTLSLGCFVGCNKEPAPNADGNDDTPPSPPAAEPYQHSERYFTEAQFNHIKTALEERDAAFGALDEKMTPAISLNVAALSDCSITSISIPVLKTLESDIANEFTFSVSIIGSSLDGMGSYPIETEVLKLSAKDYELEENSYVCRYITIDLSHDPIVLGQKETLALGDPDDTLIAAFVKTERSDMADYMKMECKETGMFTQGCSDKIAYDMDLLCFDFTVERTYESEAVYQAFVAEQKAAEDAFQAKVAALKAAGYKGKKVSVVGDSISTFGGVSNSTSINSTIGDNNVYNTKDKNVCDWTMTYWGRLITELEMELCVPNCYSGGRAYGTESKENGKDSMLYRADQLHRDGGTPDDPTDDVAPDVIIVYMAINDMMTSPRNDDFLKGVTDVAATTARWKTNVVDPLYNAYDPSKMPVLGTTYKSWQEAYAMGIMLMQETYPNAEIWLMTLVDNHNHSSGKNGNIDYGNLYIRAMAEVLGVKLIDQQKNGYITKANAYLYGQDEGTGIYALHPNVMGHELTMRLIVEEMYKHLS